MSYSRWSTSRWYSYWDSDSLGHLKSDEFVTESEKRDMQTLIVWDSKSDEFSFTYKEILDKETKLLKKLQKESSCSDEEIKFVKKIMKRFVRDVKEDFNNGNL